MLSLSLPPLPLSHLSQDGEVFWSCFPRPCSERECRPLFVSGVVEATVGTRHNSSQASLAHEATHETTTTKNSEETKEETDEETRSDTVLGVNE